MPETQWTYEEILAALPPIISQCTGCEEEDVVAEANFRHDLGGDSIEDLDLTFRLEKEFGVRRPLQPLMELGESVEQDGTIPDQAISQACARWPFLVPAIDRLKKPRLHPADLQEIYTVDLIARLIQAGGSQ